MAGAEKTLEQIKGDTPWTEAEERLITEARSGFVDFGAICPEDSDDAPRIRAALIRHLVTGGCADLPVPDTPVGVRGAVITGRLDLEAVKSHRDLRLFDCRLLHTPDLDDAELGGVYLPGCALPGLTAQRLKTDRDVHLRNGFHATGEVDLAGARITGQLSCINGRFENPGGVSLNGDALQVGADVFLSNGFHATGEVNLTGARITGQLSCINGRFENPGGKALNGDTLQVGADAFLRNGFKAEGLVNLARAHVQGSLQCQNGRFDGGLFAEALRVEAALFWCGLAGVSGPLVFNDAHVGRLCDDADSWRGAKWLFLSGFRYDRLDSGMSVDDRLDWLSRKVERRFPRTRPYREPPYVRTLRYWAVKLRRSARQFDPQPYSQLAAVLHAQGNREGAAQVLEERDNRLSRVRFHRILAQVDGELGSSGRAALAYVRRHVWDRLFGAVFGYGHRPGRAVYWVVGLWVTSALLFAQVWAADQMAPESPIVLTSPDWITAVEAHEADRAGPLPLALWKSTPAAQDYETFNATLYALDVFVPLDALGQEAAWSPSPVRGTWGKIGFHAKPALQIAGWLITAVGAAALTGLVGRKD